jgi:murein DD-endopeptidase MepM/ murein hydrolase activator NlpD
MVWGSAYLRGAPQAGRGGASGPVNLSRLGAGTQPPVPASRRGAWFITALALSSIATGFGSIALIEAGSLEDASRPPPVHITLAPSSPAPPAAAGPVTTPAGIDPAPEVTGSVSPRARPAHAEDAPPLRRFDGPPPLEGASAAVERAALMAARAALAGIAGRQSMADRSVVDRPTVLGAEAAPLRLASLAVPQDLPVAGLRPGAGDEEAGTDTEAPADTILIAENDTLYDILEARGVATSEAVAIARALAEVFPPQDLRAGQELTLASDRDEDANPVVRELVLMTRAGEFAVSRLAGGGFAATARPIAESELEHRRALAAIKGSLYGTARAQGVPDPIIVRMMRTHSYDVDFQREIHPGDLFEVFYAAGGNGVDGSAARGQLLYSSLATNGKTRSYYRFTDEGGVTDFYDESGTSAKKPLMKTPINGARISSGFGMRKHPILGYTKLHGGTDFAAPAGTPILAAGDGVVEAAGRNGGYGTYVKLKHKSGLATAYAHMSGLARAMNPGKRVRQGDVIGYVGSSGQATGPHLHYEVHLDGRKVNPLTVKVAGGGRRLEGAELAAFEAERNRIDELRAGAPVEALVAAARP